MLVPPSPYMVASLSDWWRWNLSQIRGSRVFTSSRKLIRKQHRRLQCCSGWQAVTSSGYLPYVWMSARPSVGLFSFGAGAVNERSAINLEEGHTVVEVQGEDEGEGIHRQVCGRQLWVRSVQGWETLTDRRTHMERFMFLLCLATQQSG